MFLWNHSLSYPYLPWPLTLIYLQTDNLFPAFVFHFFLSFPILTNKVWSSVEEAQAPISLFKIAFPIQVDVQQSQKQGGKCREERRDYWFMTSGTWLWWLCSHVMLSRPVWPHLFLDSSLCASSLFYVLSQWLCFHPEDCLWERGIEDIRIHSLTLKFLFSSLFFFFPFPSHLTRPKKKIEMHT